MDKDTSLLSRVTVNHLFLSQFEAFRATILSLRRRNPELALSVLQTIITNGGKINNIIYSPNCSSPALLTWLCSLELFQFDEATSLWSISPDLLKLRVEFLLYIQMISSRVSDNAEDVIHSNSSEGGELSDINLIEELDSCKRVVDKLMELGFRRMKENLIVDDGREIGDVSDENIEDDQLLGLRKAVLDNAGVFDALCVNIDKELREGGPDDSDVAITFKKERAIACMEKDKRLIMLIQRTVQMVHLDAMKVCVSEDDIDRVVPHLSYLHLDHGVEEAEYRMVFQDLLKKVLSGQGGFGDSWISKREKMFLIYQGALSSSCMHLVQLIQVIQDELLAEEIEIARNSSEEILPPLHKFLLYYENLELDMATDKDSPSMELLVSSCMRDMYHYARVAGLHVLECVMDASLNAVKQEELEKASRLMLLFPRLQPLVAAMGWDLLHGKTEARRKLMKLLWTSKSRVYQLEESSLYENQSDEKSSVEHLCDTLCYQLDLASYVACVNSGQAWNLKSSLFFSRQEQVEGKDDCANLDPFVENFVLERLAFQSPLRVLFDVVPDVNFEDAIKLISMQPIASIAAAWKRMQDIELMHMRYAIECAALALGAMEESESDDGGSNYKKAMWFLINLRQHMEAINNVPRKIYLVNIIVSLLHIDGIAVNLAQHCYLKWSTAYKGEEDAISFDGDGNKPVVSFMELLLQILHHNLPSDNALEETDVDIGRPALEWRISTARSFIRDWEWRLSMLQQLLPLRERKWRWKEALTILRAAPSKLLNLCLQRAKYEIGEEAVHRFSLPPEDKATLALAEWVDGTFKRTYAEDTVSRASEGTTTIQEIDFISLRSQIGPLATILLCIDVAAASARSTNMAQQLLDQAQVMLSEIYPGGSPKIGPTYWDQIREVALISVAKRLLKRLHELLEQDNPPALQAVLSGEVAVASPNRQGQRDRALAMLHQMIEDAHQGKRQFLSGKLHNLARAVVDEEMGTYFTKGNGVYMDQKSLSDYDMDWVLGTGLRAGKQAPSTRAAADVVLQPVTYDVKDTGKRPFSPMSPKPSTYLSQFILHIAAIGDIVDGADTTHDFNYFSLVYEWPKDLVTRLVFEQGSTDAAEKVAEIMSTDFVHEVISACVPPVYPPQLGQGWACIPIPSVKAKGGDGNKQPLLSGNESTEENSRYPLQLDILKHLVKVSPIRAVLACLFGRGLLYNGREIFVSGSLNSEVPHSPDADRFFYEFALDQSERFPTLNRWIQMQTNLHRVSEFTVTSSDSTKDDVVKAKSRPIIKRPRDNEGDTESEVDCNSFGGSVTAFSEPNLHKDTGLDPLQESLNYDTPVDDPMVFVSFDWQNEEPYERAVERLIEDGNLMDALSLSDRFLRNGASDKLLRLLIESSEGNCSKAESLGGYGGETIWSNSWEYCLRLKDKRLAAKLAIRYLHTWDLAAALDVLTMCSCHLPDGDAIKNETLQRKQALLRYNHILCSDNCYQSWQEVEAACKEDPEGLALKLAEKGAVSAALEVAESTGLSIDLRRELQGRQLVKLLTEDPLNRGGPAEASRFLSSLRGANDALPVVMGAMQLLPNLRSKQLLVHFFLKRKDGNLSDAEVSRLNLWALGLRVLSALPLPWQQRCSSLHEHPQLIVEVLLMRKQLESASLILKAFPSLRDNNMFLTYAAKAIVVSISAPSREPRTFVSGARLKQKVKSGTPTRSSFTSSLSNFHKEARRAFSWAPRSAGDKTIPKETVKKRKSSGLVAAEKNAWESMTGIQEERVSSFSGDTQERLPSVSIAEEWMLTGDPSKDNAVRSAHRYDSAPDIILFKALLSLCSDESVSAKGAMDLCVNQMKGILSSQQLPQNASVETIGRAYLATESFVQGLLYARSLLRKLVGVTDFSGSYERGRDIDDASSDAGSSSVSIQAADELSELLSQVDLWLRRAELLQSLLGSGIAASLDDIADQNSSAMLRDRLIAEERYSMAVYTCKKCKIDVFPVWIAWGHALLRIEHYDQARVKFKQALQLHRNDIGGVIVDIVNTIESSPPVDVSAARSMYEHLAKSAPTILDDSLSADSYLNVLHMPSTLPRSERSRWFQMSADDGSMGNCDFEDGPRSNLDSVRYLECVNYFQEYARQHLLVFMFRHGHYKEACALFFPLNAIPPPPQPSSLGVVTSSSSPQRPDPLATDYGTVDDLCEFCVGYGAMRVLEETISTRMSSEASTEVSVAQHTISALARICNYCETHRHFNYLYNFLVIRQDHVAAGLCCIQLFMNSSSQDDAVKHLEHAKMHFDEGLSARSKPGQGTKLIIKNIRGKSASEKLTEEGLVKLSARVAMQVDVVRSLNDPEGPQWKHSLFGNPGDPETYRRRCQIAETLSEKNFDLAFRVIYEFHLPEVDIYAAVAASLAERKKGGQLTEFFKNIKGTIEDGDMDQVLGAAINVYANKHKERPDRLIDMLTSSHRKVLACVICGRLKSAFQIASRSGSVADVQYVAHQALHANALPVLDMCKQWLAQYM